jgi:hypothetical protein
MRIARFVVDQNGHANGNGFHPRHEPMRPSPAPEDAPAE